MAESAERIRRMNYMNILSLKLNDWLFVTNFKRILDLLSSVVTLAGSPFFKHVSKKPMNLPLRQ